MRCVSTRVLPEPAPATTRIGPSGATTASRWRSFSPSRSASAEFTGVTGRVSVATGPPRSDALSDGRGARSDRLGEPGGGLLQDALLTRLQHQLDPLASAVERGVRADRDVGEALADRAQRVDDVALGELVDEPHLADRSAREARLDQPEDGPHLGRHAREHEHPLELEAGRAA